METHMSEHESTEGFFRLQEKINRKRRASLETVQRVGVDFDLIRDPYHSLLMETLQDGTVKPGNRTGTHSLSSGPARMSYHLGQSDVVYINTKSIHTKSVLTELEWFMKGITDNQWLVDRGVTIWNEWVKSKRDTDLGPIYGKLWRDFGGVDQLAGVFQSLKNDPFSRRHVVSAWNPPELDEAALPPCHILFQFDVQREVYKKDPDKQESGFDPDCYVDDIRLNLSVYQRSMDLFLGGPFNLMSYSTLLQIFCHALGYRAGRLNYSVGDAHIYENHLSQVELQLIRHYAQTSAEKNQRGQILFEDDPMTLKPWDYSAGRIKVSTSVKNNSIIAPVAV